MATPTPTLKSPGGGGCLRAQCPLHTVLHPPAHHVNNQPAPCDLSALPTGWLQLVLMRPEVGDVTLLHGSRPHPTTRAGTGVRSPGPRALGGLAPRGSFRLCRALRCFSPRLLARSSQAFARARGFSEGSAFHSISKCVRSPRDTGPDSLLPCFLACSFFIH